MLERDREPGIPVRCAEGVSHEGVVPYIELDKRWIATRIDKAKLTAPNGETATLYNNGIGYVLERRLFDNALAELACQKGATLLTKANATGFIRNDDKITGVKYTHLGKEKEVFCDIIIGADGVESRVGRWAGLKTDVDLKDIDTCVQYAMTGIEVEKDTIEFFFGSETAPGGYVWIFPKSDNRANVGIGISGHLALEKGPKKYLDQFVKRHFPEGKITSVVYGGVPTAKTLNKIVADNLMIVGDAARQVNPMTGGGLAQGMFAASIAGKVAAEAVKAGDFTAGFLKKYRDQWNKRLGNIQNTMYAMKEKVIRMPDKRFNRLVRICQGIPRDDFSLKKLFTEAVKGDPKLMLEVAKAFVVSKLK
jgi:digeranylgeranylglycerophospholipid reductase